MVQVYKILMGQDNVDRAGLFEMTNASERNTIKAADPLNRRPNTGRLEIRRNFFSFFVNETWNMLPAHVKNVPTVKSLRLVI